MSNTKLLGFLRSLMPGSERSVLLIGGLCKHKALKKGDVVLQRGGICESFYFIEKGYLRTHYDREGMEVNLHFYLDGDIASDYQIGKKGHPSEFTITAGEKSEIWILDRRILEGLCYSDPEILSFGRKLVFRLLQKFTSEEIMLKAYSPRERYTYLEENHPQLLQRISLSNLASYLGVTRRTLTRIRSER